MKEDWISSSITTGSIRWMESANVDCLPLAPRRSSGVDERFLRVLLDELAAGLHVLAHQDAEHPVRRGGVLQGDLLEHPAFGVHGRLPELLGLHLGQALEPQDRHLPVPRLRQVELVPDPRPDGADERLDLQVLERLVQTGLLNVQDLAPDGEDGLERTLPGLLRRATG